MKTFQDLLKDLSACKEAKEWAGEMTIEEVVEKCERGDWLLWLAARVEVNKRNLTLAKGHCANTVRHLMKYERSIAAVDAAIAYGEGQATDEDLTAAAADADAADAYNADYAAAAAAYAAAAADADADAAAARKENQMQTANICREVIGKEIIDKVNELLN